MAGGTEELSEREKDVLRLLATGHTAKSAADELHLSVHTINDYLREARKKLRVGSSREAARALAEREDETPQKSANEKMGISGPTTDGHFATANQPQERKGRTFAWIIAGALMITIVLSIAMLVTAPSGPTSAPSSIPEAIGEADRSTGKAALDWIGLVDRGRYGESWKAAGGMFRKAVTDDAWTKTVEPVRKPLGDVKRRSLIDVSRKSSLPGAPAGDYRVVRFSTDFAKAPGAVETVVMQREEGAFRVIGYFIK